MSASVKNWNKVNKILIKLSKVTSCGLEWYSSLVIWHIKEIKLQGWPWRMNFSNKCSAVNFQSKLSSEATSDLKSPLQIWSRLAQFFLRISTSAQLSSARLDLRWGNSQMSALQSFYTVNWIARWFWRKSPRSQLFSVKLNLLWRNSQNSAL